MAFRLIWSEANSRWPRQQSSRHKPEGWHRLRHLHPSKHSAFNTLRAIRVERHTILPHAGPTKRFLVYFECSSKAPHACFQRRWQVVKVCQARKRHCPGVQSCDQLMGQPERHSAFSACLRFPIPQGQAAMHGFGQSSSLRRRSLLKFLPLLLLEPTAAKSDTWAALASSASWKGVLARSALTWLPSSRSATLCRSRFC